MSRSVVSGKDAVSPVDPSPRIEPSRTTAEEVAYRAELEKYYAASPFSHVEKLQNFAKYVPVQDLRKFLCRLELFRRVLHVHGAIIECGVLHGGGLMAWAQLSEIFEPLNHLRTIIGFDTFSGFVSMSEHDRSTAVQAKVGGLAVDSYEDLKSAIALYDRNRVLRHIEKVRLVRGDVATSLPEYISAHPHLVVSLLYLDFDTYQPTVVALRELLPRMPKGAVIAFDELNHEMWPGETVAVMETIGLPRLRLERFAFGSTVSFAVLE
jgi:hypothetical protein